MEDITRTQQDNLADKTTPPPFSLPLVSVIIVNYNYGRFLKQAADSVFEQTYPDIECIIVDNASTDESAGVLQDIARQYPGTKMLRRNKNGGQSLALMEGFAASSGEYVVFLDADDYLLTTFVETHVFVHLSLRVPVGFSSSDVIQAVDSRMVLGTFAYLSDFVRSGRGNRPSLLRRIDKSAPGVWPLPSPDASIETEVHLVDPWADDWMWAPTSGNCFRRDALQLFLNSNDLAVLRSCTDSYLVRGINIATGSVVIDRPLSVYRVHGMNAFSKHPHLNGILNYDRDSPSDDNNQLGLKLIVDHLIANAQLFLRKMNSPENYMSALQTLDRSWPRLPSTVPGCRSYLVGKIVTEAATLSPALGFLNLVALLKRLKASPHIILKVILKACLKRKTKKQS